MSSRRLVSVVGRRTSSKVSVPSNKHIFTQFSRSTSLNHNNNNGLFGMLSVEQRNMGFFSEFKKRFSEKVESSEEMQKALKELREEEKLKKASEVANKTAEKASAQAQKAKEAASVAGKKVGEFTEDVKDRLDDFSDNPYVSKTGQAVGKTLSGIGGVGVKLAEKIIDVSENVAEKVTKTEAAKSIGKQFEEDEGPKDTKVEGVPIDRTTQHVTIRPETEWERRWKKLEEAPVLGSLVKGLVKAKEVAKDGVSTAGDKVFGETETGIVMMEIKKYQPHFFMPRFLRELKEEMIPKVIGAFLVGDLETLRPMCLDRSYTVLSYIIKDRKAKGHIVDARILEVGDVDLISARLVEENPVLILSFSVQQINCVKDKKGNIIQGGEGNIEITYYAWAMQIDPDSADSEWKLSEMHIQGSFPQIA